MTVNIRIKNICISSTPNHLDVLVLIGKSENNFCMHIYDEAGIYGVKIPEQLVSILCQNLEGNRRFIKAILSFYKGESLNFPVDIGLFNEIAKS